MFDNAEQTGSKLLFFSYLTVTSLHHLMLKFTYCTLSFYRYMSLKCIGFSFENSSKFISTQIYYAKNSVSHWTWPWESQNPHANEILLQNWAKIMISILVSTVKDLWLITLQIPLHLFRRAWTFSLPTLSRNINFLYFHICHPFNALIFIQVFVTLFFFAF